MPNLVKNIVRMEGISKLPLYKKGEDGREVFDFNKVIPMPESLEIESGTVEDLAMESALTLMQTALKKKYFGPRIEFVPGIHEPLKEALRRQNTTIEEMGKLGLKYIENMVLYGATTWYEWSIENWGTKWNAVDPVLVDDDTLVFSTAWSEPGPVICKLHEMYPDADIEHTWADEDVGSNSGRRWVIDGDMDAIDYEQNSHEALEAYIECWGESGCIYRDDDGVLRMRDCDDCDGCG